MKPARLKKTCAANLAKKPLRPEGEPMASPNLQMPANDGKPALPKGWVWTRFAEIVDKVSLTGRKIKQSEYLFTGELPVIDQGQAFIGGYTDREDLKVSENPVVIFGDHTKIIKYVDFDFVAGADGVKIIKPHNCFYPKLFYYFLQNIDLPEKGYARHFQFLEKSFIPLPPLPEQHRIVAKIEELFTKLDAGVAALKKAKAQLQRYRQSVLKDAFSGKLTQAWREAHQHELEPAAVLLERIKAERKKNAKGKYKEPPAVDASDLPELPEGWVWARVGEISEMMQYGTSEKADEDASGIPVLRMGNIKDGKLDFANLKYFPKSRPELKEYILKDGDVLFNRTNSAELVGKTAVYKSSHPKAVFASYLIRARVNREFFEPDILSWFINSFEGRKYISSVVSQQVGQANVNGTKLSMMPVPFLAQLEQRKIVEEIERRFSIAEEVEKVIDHSLKQAERLRQSILQRAFAGKLVPQDPNDEPAEKLLERIVRSRS